MITRTTAFYFLRDLTPFDHGQPGLRFRLVRCAVVPEGGPVDAGDDGAPVGLECQVYLGRGPEGGRIVETVYGWDRHGSTLQGVYHEWPENPDSEALRRFVVLTNWGAAARVPELIARVSYSEEHPRPDEPPPAFPSRRGEPLAAA